MRILSILLVCVLSGCNTGIAVNPDSDSGITYPDGMVNADDGGGVDSSTPDGGVTNTDGAVANGCLATDTDTRSITIRKPYMLGGQINLDGQGTGACGQPDFSDGTDPVVDNGFYNATMDSYLEFRYLSSGFGSTQPLAPSVGGYSYIDITLTHMGPANGDMQLDDPCVGVEIHTYTTQYDVGTVAVTGAVVAGHLSVHVDSVDVDLHYIDAVISNIGYRCNGGCPTDTVMHMSIADITLNVVTSTTGGVITYAGAQMGGYIVDAVSMYSQAATDMRMSNQAPLRAPAFFDVLVQNGHIVPCNGTAPNALSVQIMSWD